MFNFFILGLVQLGGESLFCLGEELDLVYFFFFRYYQVILYWRILILQMDGTVVFCIICSLIYVMLCKFEFKVDGCNLRGSLVYVYLRSSFVYLEDKVQSRELGGCQFQFWRFFLMWFFVSRCIFRFRLLQLGEVTQRGYQVVYRRGCFWKMVVLQFVIKR